MLIHKFGIPSFAPRRITRHKIRKLTLFITTYLLVIVSLSVLYLYSYPETEARPDRQTLGVKTANKRSPNVAVYKVPSTTHIPSSTPSPTVTVKPIIPTNTPQPTSIPAISMPIEDTTKTISNVSNDSSMASASDIFNALNSYRAQNGAPSLSWEGVLADLAVSRVNTFASNNSMDSHAGFREYMTGGGFEKSGFNGLGENSAQLSGPMGGDKIIREIFGASSSHNSSQLDGSWTHVGIAVNGNFVNVNFGKNKR